MIGSFEILPPPSGVWPRDLPEEQAGDRTDRKAPAEQMNRHDRGNRQQGQQAQRRREDHAASSTPAAASPRATSRIAVSGHDVREAGAGTTRRTRQTQPQAREAGTVVANRRVVEHQVQLPLPFDVDQPLTTLRLRLGLLAQRELDEGEERAVAREPRHESVGVVREQEVAHDNAQRAPPQREVRHLERREARVTAEKALDVFRPVQRLRPRSRRS